MYNHPRASLTGIPLTLLIVSLGALAALPPLSIDISLPGLPAIGTSLHAAGGSMQWTLSSFVIAFGIGQLLLGPLSDRYGRRTVLIGGLGIFTLAGIACTFAADAHILVLARAVQGFGACAGTVCARAIAADISIGPRRGASLQAYVSAINSLGPIVAPIIGAVILTILGWRSLYGVLVVAGILLLLAVWRNIEETSVFVRGGMLAAYRRVFQLPRTIPLAGFAFASFGAYFALITASPFALITQFHVSPAVFAIAFAINAVGALLGSLTLGRLTKHIDFEEIYGYGAALTLVAGVIVTVFDALFPSVAAFILTMMLYGFAFGASIPSAFAAALGDAGADSGTAAGTLGAAQMIGGALSSAAVGLLPWNTTDAVALVVAANALLALAAYLFSRSVRS